MRRPKRAWDAETLLRSQTLLDVTAGRKTSKEAARSLGVSRKTWHAWQRRGLEAMLEGLSRRPPGRRAAPADPEKEALRRRVWELEARVAELERSLIVQRARCGTLERSPAFRKADGRRIPEPPGPGCRSKKKRLGRRKP